jgi:hypothetical protein
MRPPEAAAAAAAAAHPGWTVAHAARKVAPRDVPGLLPPGLTAAT